MRFRPKEDFKHGHSTFEEGNSYASEKHGLTDVEVMSFYSAGWADVEGLDPAPPRQVKGVEVQAQKPSHLTATTEV